jgi:hypothetical protein
MIHVYLFLFETQKSLKLWMYTNILTTFVTVTGSAYLFFREAD